jgi:IS5 family transposase
VVFFKLQLVMFFEGIRSERQLMRHAADRLSIRWYLGYDLGEPLPDHSSLTRIRERYGIDVFRRFFEQIVEQCQAAGLVWGKELYFDGTKVAANAGKDSLKPRFYVDAHLDSLFGETSQRTEQESPTEEKVGSAAHEQEERSAPAQLPTSLSPEEQEHLAQENTQRHDWLEKLGAQDRSVTGRCYQRVADLQVSTTDPDATLMLTKNGADLGYHTHYVVDGGKARIILNVLVTPTARDGQSTDARPALAHALPLETLAATGHRRQEVRNRRQPGRHRRSGHSGLHPHAGYGSPHRVL